MQKRPDQENNLKNSHSVSVLPNIKENNTFKNFGWHSKNSPMMLFLVEKSSNIETQLKQKYIQETKSIADIKSIKIAPILPNFYRNETRQVSKSEFQNTQIYTQKSNIARKLPAMTPEIKRYNEINPYYEFSQNKMMIGEDLNRQTNGILQRLSYSNSQNQLGNLALKERSSCKGYKKPIVAMNPLFKIGDWQNDILSEFQNLPKRNKKSTLEEMGFGNLKIKKNDKFLKNKSKENVEPKQELKKLNFYRFQIGSNSKKLPSFSTEATPQSSPANPSKKLQEMTVCKEIQDITIKGEECQIGSSQLEFTFSFPTC